MAKKDKGAEPGAKTHNKKATANSGRTLKHNVDPNTLYFTHARIRPQFTGCNKMIQDTIDEIVSGQTKVTDIPYITVIENFEEVYLEPDPKEKAKKTGGNKRRNRKGGDESDDEDDWLKGKPQATTTKSFYFSLNNRRLFLFKTLKQMGLVDTITVYVKPALEREKVKYQRKNCVIMAKMMSRKELEEAGEEKADEDDDETAPAAPGGQQGPPPQLQKPQSQQQGEQTDQQAKGKADEDAAVASPVVVNGEKTNDVPAPE